jgi:hypothetical protein
MFGSKIKQLREELQLPQRVVASALELNTPMYSRTQIPIFATVLKTNETELAPKAVKIALEKALQKLRAEFSGFDDWNEEAKKALLEREIQTILVNIPQRIVAKVKANEEPNRKEYE